jgi:F-type H+-transporting ATPase subunit a
VTETKPKRNINRWIVVLLLVAIVVVSGIVPPISPVVSLKAEPLMEHPLFTLPVIGDLYLTNTLLTALIIDIVIILLAFSVRRGLGDEKHPSKGVAAVFEAILGYLYDMVGSTAGKKWAGFIFPIMATIMIMVLFSNLAKLLPGFETIGFIKEAHGEGYAKVELLPWLSMISKSGMAEAAHTYEVVPFFRSPSTDLNFTAALAVAAVVMVQVIGYKANGLGYFSKFLNFGRFVRMWSRKNLGPFDVINPFIDIFVGILETISEFAKIISFSFRLLGSMFGGAVLVIVMGSLVPAVLFGLYFLELFFGVIQALVFGFLTLVFMTVATQAHGHEEHAEAH